MPDTVSEAITAAAPSLETSGVDFVALIRFLVEPLLDGGDELKVDCEVQPHRSRLWLRLAFNTDKGRVFGRGGRTIQSIRSILEAAGKTTGYAVHLEIFGEREHRETQGDAGRKDGSRRNGPPRSHPTRR